MYGTCLKGISGLDGRIWICPCLSEDIQHEGNNIFLPQYSSEENPGSRASTQGEFSYHALKEYPMNNMVTGNV